VTRPEEGALYDSIGPGYQTTRRADSHLAALLWDHLNGRPAGRYLDVGCGTGNYTAALSRRGGVWTGIDASDSMLQEARRAHADLSWHHASADNLPFPDSSFDGAMATLVIHHLQALPRPFQEVRRVLCGGRFVLFTAFPEQMQHYWLHHYFPGMIERSARMIPSESALRAALSDAGFTSVRVEPFHVTCDLQDLFLYAGKERPELYLDPAVRANISSFRTLCDESERVSGLGALESDLRSGAFEAVARRYASTLGDYAFVIADTEIQRHSLDH
jgi:ubiquinone/menaquinone biosynthesis C-methylase UbiE